MEQPRSLTLESLIKAQNKNNGQNGGKRSLFDIVNDPSLQPGSPEYVPNTPKKRAQQWVENRLEKSHSDINVGPALNEYGEGAGLSPEVLDYFRNTSAPKLDGSGEHYGPPERVNLKEARELLDAEKTDDATNTEQKPENGALDASNRLGKAETINKRQTGEKFAPAFGKSQLRYPYETTESAQDYIRFSIFKYKRAKRALRGDNNRAQAVFARGTGDVTVETNPRDLLGSILLPVPAQVTDSNTAAYGDNSLNSFAARGFEGALDVATGANPEEALRRGIDSIKSFAGLAVDNRNLLVTSLVANAVNQFGANLDINSVLARSSGQIINPNMELLFNAPTLRQFKFQFKFTPRFEKETLEVKRIIKAFKKNMSPKSGQTGQTLTTPNIFQLQYVKGNGRPQGFLHQFKLCALTDISVNYTGDGTYATYYDGTPVSMTMALSFNELSPVYNEDYDLRDNRGGVGF